MKIKHKHIKHSTNIITHPEERRKSKKKGIRSHRKEWKLTRKMSGERVIFSWRKKSRRR